MSAPVSVKIPSETRVAVAAAAAVPEREVKVKAPAFKRPEGMGDLEWLLLRESKSPDMAKQIIATLDGTTPATPEMAALMLDVTKGAEMRALRQIRKLQTSIAPKIKALSSEYNELASASAHLFVTATRV